MQQVIGVSWTRVKTEQDMEMHRSLWKTGGEKRHWTNKEKQMWGARDLVQTGSSHKNTTYYLLKTFAPVSHKQTARESLK